MTTSLALFLAFILAGVPIAFSLGAAALAGLWLIEGAPLRIVASRIFGGIDNFSLLAIPFFILAGELMETGGISQRLVNLARVLVGHIRGGLGNVVLIAMVFFSGISGSTNADAAAPSENAIGTPARMNARKRASDVVTPAPREHPEYAWWASR